MARLRCSVLRRDASLWALVSADKGDSCASSSCMACASAEGIGELRRGRRDGCSACASDVIYGTLRSGVSAYAASPRSNESDWSGDSIVAHPEAYTGSMRPRSLAGTSGGTSAAGAGALHKFAQFFQHGAGRGSVAGAARCATRICDACAPAAPSSSYAGRLRTRVARHGRLARDARACARLAHPASGRRTRRARDGRGAPARGGALAAGHVHHAGVVLCAHGKLAQRVGGVRERREPQERAKAGALGGPAARGRWGHGVQGNSHSVS